MGKRSNFKRRAHDVYDTPADAVLPLLRHLNEGTRFIEPCAGKGDLADHLVNAGHTFCGLYDLKPRRGDIVRANALTHDYGRLAPGTVFITNPPWTRELLHPIIINLAGQGKTWLLFDSDWAYTVQARPYLRFCRSIVSVGRVQWIPGTENTGKENAAWYLFDGSVHGQTVFYNQ